MGSRQTLHHHVTDSLLEEDGGCVCVCVCVCVVETHFILDETRNHSNLSDNHHHIFNLTSLILVCILQT